LFETVMWQLGDIWKVVMKVLYNLSLGTKVL